MSVATFLKKLHPNALGEALRAATFADTDDNNRFPLMIPRSNVHTVSRDYLTMFVNMLHDETPAEYRNKYIAEGRCAGFTEGDANIFVIWNGPKHHDNDRELCFFVQQSGKWILCVGTDYSLAKDLWYFKAEF